MRREVHSADVRISVERLQFEPDLDLSFVDLARGDESEAAVEGLGAPLYLDVACADLLRTGSRFDVVDDAGPEARLLQLQHTNPLYLLLRPRRRLRVRMTWFLERIIHG